MTEQQFQTTRRTTHLQDAWTCLDHALTHLREAGASEELVERVLEVRRGVEGVQMGFGEFSEGGE